MGAFVQQHEDRNTTGIPDFSFSFQGVDGWIEVKWLKKAPPADFQPSQIEHFTPVQREWLKKAGARGSGHCYLWVGWYGGFRVWQWDQL